MQPCVGGTELVLVLEFYTSSSPPLPCLPPPFLKHYPSLLFYLFIPSSLLLLSLSSLR